MTRKPRASTGRAKGSPPGGKGGSRAARGQAGRQQAAGKGSAAGSGAGPRRGPAQGQARTGRRPPPTRVSTAPPKATPSGKRGQVRKSDSRPSGPPAGKTDRQRTVGGEQVEGRHAVLELLMAGARKVQNIWISAEVGDAPILDDIQELAEANGVPVHEVAKSKFAAQARCEAPQGVLALAAPLPEFDLDDLLTVRPMPSRARSRQVRRGTTPFLVALDGVTDPGNLGAVLRSAECAGATGVILPKHRAVNVTPAATKAAAGAAEHLPVALVGGLPNALMQLRDAGVWIVGLDGDAELPLHEMPSFDGGVCLVLGAEGRGVSRLVRQRCDETVRIPLHGQLPSLNVSAAAALACFEIARRR